MTVRALKASINRPGWRSKARTLLELWWALPVLNDELRRADVVHVRLPSYEGLLALALIRGRPRPTLVWIGGNWMERILLTRDSPLRRLLSRGLPALLARLLRDHVVFVMGDQLPQGLRGVRAWHRDVATSVWSRELVDPLSRPWPLQPGRLELIYVGRLSPEKGLAALLAALARPAWRTAAADQGLDWRLTVVGAGPLEADLRAQAAAAALPVRFAGRCSRDEVGRRLDTADVFVLPSLTDASPKVVIEALVHGLPVVASRVGGLPRLLNEGERGMLLPAADPEAWARGLAGLVQDGALRARLCRAGHEWARTQTLEAQRERLRAALRDHYGPGVVRAAGTEGGHA